MSHWEILNHLNPNDKTIKKDSWIKQYSAVSVKINRDTRRWRWKNCCYWLIVKRSWINHIFCRYFFSCIYFREIWILYIFSRMPFKKKSCVSLILQNRPKFVKFAKTSTIKSYLWTWFFQEQIVLKCQSGSIKWKTFHIWNRALAQTCSPTIHALQNFPFKMLMLIVHLSIVFTWLFLFLFFSA